ncbi:MAG TPA: asparagine synthase (glutamine-hydrolyzing), partial [Hanamia sp.]|nr:asparagine synthase (glutamine-hydrolyzing) [Hanamia sp.]
FNNNKYQIGLGHRRLSIIDLSECGNQPMTDETGNYTIILNGEVYNFKEIKTELQSSGFSFFSTSDTEVILKAYIKWGIKAIDKFIGMFAFVIYDKQNNTIIFCRDRTGVKPLYYFLDSDLILFGSELKSLMAHPSFKKNIDFNALASFLRHGWIGAPHTIFQCTYKLKPGHYLEINLNTKKTREECYWDVHDYYNKENLTISFEEAQEQLHDLLKSACEYRMVADTEVGIFLSGGFDSSTVTAILQKNRSKKINTFSIGFEDEQFNEAPFAKAVANHLGTNHHEIICTAKDALDLIPHLPYYYDEPFADSSAIPTMLVSKLASSKVKVALSADGGDEVFGGYTRYYDKLDEFNKVQAIPTVFKKPLAGLLSVPINFMDYPNPHKKVRLEKLKKILSEDNSSEMFRYRSEPILYSNNEIRNLLKKKNVNLSLKTFYDNNGLKTSLDPATYMMALEYKTTLVDDVLVKVDRATMAYSLEGREPFLDHRLVEFCARFNSNFHFRNQKTKSLLREICYEYIPNELMDRPKRGFAIPTNKWLHHELKEMVMELSQADYIQKQGIFEHKKCTVMIENYYRGFDKDGERIWFFLMFQMWYNKWMS